jgi:hypothetical protein
MPCNGWNHSSTCECGWGGVWHGNVKTSRVFEDGNTKLDEFGSPLEARSFIRSGTVASQKVSQYQTHDVLCVALPLSFIKTNTEAVCSLTNWV